MVSSCTAAPLTGGTLNVHVLVGCRPSPEWPASQRWNVEVGGQGIATIAAYMRSFVAPDVNRYQSTVHFLAEPLPLPVRTSHTTRA